MAAPCYISYSGLHTALTAAITPVASAVTVIPKTIQQVKSGTGKLRIIEWGYMFTTTPAAPVIMELVETGLINATVTTGSTPSNYNDVTGIATLTAAVGTASTGFNASAEGTITATRLFAMTYDTAQYFKQQFPLGREPEVNAASFLRVRATPGTAASVSMTTYIIWEE